MKKLLLFLITLFPLLLFGQEIGTWQNENANSGNVNPRHEAGYVELNEKFYLLGGRGIKSVNIYDPKTKSWSNGEAPPMQVHHFQPVAYDGKIYCIGAMTGNFPSETGIPNILIYDPDADDWITGASIPQNRIRGGAGLVLHQEKFYLVSGIVDGHRSGHVTWLDRYDPKTDNWEILKDAPRARDHFQASVIDGKIYAVGGRRSMAGNGLFDHPVAEVDVYDIATDEWTTLSNNIPTNRAGCYNAVYGKEVLVLGGESGDQQAAHDEVEALNTETGMWRNLPSLIDGRHGSGAVWYNNTLYTVSGSGNRGGTPELSSQEKLNFEEMTTSIKPAVENNLFRIFPNPVSNQTIKVRYTGNEGPFTFELYDLKGRLVAKETGIHQFPYEWDLGNKDLDNTMHLLIMQAEQTSYWHKVVFK